MLIRNDLSKLVELVLNGDGETSSLIEQAYPVYFIYQVKSDLGLPAADATAPDLSLAAAASERGIFRTWQRVRINLPELSELPLTEEALSYHAVYEPLVDDPLLSCTTPGLPRAMTFAGPHPIEFFEDENEITLRMEYMNNDRVIHMEPAAMS